ncbi:MAG TPA: hypothetical protein VKY85_27910 [Candidatus Angelobacter sp.]|nr:hypothetical protein [Candidatus Angelobacter sp.]
MRLLRKLWFIGLISGLAMAQTNQTNVSNTTADPSDLADQVKQLRELMVQQQKQLADQQNELEKLRQQVGAQPQPVAANSTDGVSEPRLVNASLTAPTTSPVAKPVSSGAVQEDRPKESPLSFRIGGAEFTPGGFMDFTSIFRTTNSGNAGGTNFFAIPFSNTIGGHLTEERFTAQNSRVSMKATSKFGKNDVLGYFEMDFLGNDAANVEITSNSHTLRQRLYFVDVKREKFEVIAGQMWGWLTPNRVGLDSMPSDVFFSDNMDFNYQVGLTWTRQPGVRFIYHPNDNWAMGIALENPQQFGGQGEVTFPTAFNAQLGGQIDQGAGTGVPNLHPDIIPKIAYDTDMNGKHFHAEAAGLLTGIKITNLVAGSFVKHTKEGEGVEAAVNLEVFKNFHLVANGFYSDGGGRYIFGMGPDTVALPTAAGTDVALSLVHSGSGIAGFEWQATPKALFYGYYGGAYFQRNFALDTSAGARPGTFVGFGGPNSANSNNRSIQEPTLGWIQTFWKRPQYGALQLITQASYLTRAPWFVAAGAPKNAHLVMGWVDLRYVLP